MADITLLQGNSVIVPEPTNKLAHPYVDPSETYRATNIRQMFSVAMSAASASVLYEVGLPLDSTKSYTDGILVIRNDTINTTLLISITLPSYLKTDSQLTFLLGADAKAGIKISARMAEVQEAALALTTLFREDLISISVVPHNITEPVYVRRLLAPLTV